MPQVASSSTKIHTHSHAQGRPARTQQPADPAASAPFASLLDDPAAAPAQQQPQQADASKADAASSSQTPKQPAKADGPQDQSSGAPAAGETAAGAPAASGDAALAAAAKAKAAADTAPSAPSAPKDQSKPNAGTDQTSDQGPAGTPDPTAIAAAVTPPATPQQPPTPVVAGAVDTAGSALAAPAPQAVMAGAAAPKPEALNDKTKGDPAKQTDATATGAPVNPDDQAVPPPLPQAASAPDTKIVTADRGSAAKPETQEHHAKIDATATLVGSAGGTTPTGGDTGAAGQATVAAAATATAQATGASGTTATSPQAAPAAPQAAAVPLAGLAIEIAGRAQAGKNNFEIRLDPPDLGRIQVKLSVDRQGQVTSHLIADRADTLDLLRRDSSGLERALQDAGLKTAGDGLQFSLRDQSFSGEQNTARQNVSQVVAQDDILPAVDIAASGYTRYVGRLGGVDIRV